MLEAASASFSPAREDDHWWDRDRLVPATLVLGSVLLAMNVYFLWREHQPVSDYALVVASAMLWLAAFPLWHFVVARRRYIPFAPFATTLYWIYFALPVFSETPLFFLFRTGPAWESVDEALDLSLAGLVCMLFGLYGTGRFLLNIPRIRRNIDFRRALPALVFLSAMSFAVRFATTGTTTRTYGSAIFAFCTMGQLTLGALIIAWLRGYLNLGYKAAVSALIAGLVVVGLASGLLASIALPMVGFLFVYGWERRRIPWAFVLTGALLFVPFNTAKHEFRGAMWHTSDSQLSPENVVKLMTAFVTLTVEGVENGHFGSEDITRSDEARLNVLGLLAVVVNETPRNIPYWNGYTYSDLLWHLIPRIIVPDKPSPALGQEFPRRYGFIAYYDYDTSLNLPQLVELYINFGAIGVCLGMALIGFLYALMDHFFSASTGGVIIGSIMFSFLMNMESNFSLVFGGIPFFVILFYALIHLLPGDGADTAHAAVSESA
jgi:hypothetical protein